MTVPSDWVRRCPHCAIGAASFIPIGDRFSTPDALGESRFWQTAACPACGGAVVAELDSRGEIAAIHPSGIARQWEVDHLPVEVQHIWDEAIKVFGVRAYASAVVACGRTLEAAAEERGVVGDTLQARIRKMQADGLITKEFKGAMDYVRLIRNVGAHAGDPVTKTSAEGTLRFTQQMLRLLFEVPAELTRLTARLPELENAEEDG